jgi:hypothetical protein
MPAGGIRAPVLAQSPGWIEDANEAPPKGGLRRQSPRECFHSSPTAVSGLAGATPPTPRTILPGHLGETKVYVSGLVTMQHWMSLVARYDTESTISHGTTEAKTALAVVFVSRGDYCVRVFRHASLRGDRLASPSPRRHDVLVRNTHDTNCTPMQHWRSL